MLQFFPSRTVALEILGFDVHWYGVMYLLSFLVALWIVPRLQRYRDLDLHHEKIAELLTFVVIGVIVGGRLGYVLFYEPGYFFIHPLRILAVWNGGMSSHGGFLGVGIAVVLYCHRNAVDIRKILDIAVIPAAIGLALGRMGNFINLELYGTVTTLPWGITIPGIEGLRHPTQIYAVLKDLLIAGSCFWHLTRVHPIRPGRTFAFFLMLYGVLRFFVEFFRVQSAPLLDLWILSLSRGQLLTLPVLLLGIFLWRWLRPKNE